MSVTYATYSEYTMVYSDKGVDEAHINSQWLPYGALRVNEALGACFTVPFSSNNQSARDLSIHFAHLGLLLRTRNQEDSQELKADLMSRISDICSLGMGMVTDSGDILSPSTTSVNEVWSNTQGYKSVFDMRDAVCQRIDPDYIDALNTEDV